MRHVCQQYQERPVMPKLGKKISLYKPLHIVLKENVVQEKKKKKNSTKEAKERLRKQLLKMIESDDFKILSEAGDFAISIPSDCLFIFSKMDGKK